MSDCFLFFVFFLENVIVLGWPSEQTGSGGKRGTSTCRARERSAGRTRAPNGMRTRMQSARAEQ